MSEWQKVGVIGVDAGLCWIGDPCYVLQKGSQDRPKDIGKDWGEFCDRLHDREKRGAAQWKYDAGHRGLGITVATGYGDGEYSVYVRRDRNGAITEARVVFIDDGEE